MAAPTYFFLTNAPPLVENASADHVTSLQFIKAMDETCALVITRRFRRSIKPADVRTSSPVPVYLLPDSAPFGIRRFSVVLSDLMDLAGAWLGYWRVRRYARKLRPTKMFVLVGGNGWFLLTIWLMARAVRVPFELYLVDDLEKSATLAGRKFLAKLMPRIERAVLRRAHRVFVISRGFVVHLSQKYGQPAEWLPLPIKIDNFVYRPFVRTTPDERRIVFVGGLNFLYLSAIVEFYEAIQERNRRCRDYRLKLQIVSYAPPTHLMTMLPNIDDLEVNIGVPAADLREHCARSWATFLPYSFEPEVREMVATSFASKLSDSYRAGRPIVVYGPEYASMPQYFQEAGLPLCATRRDELASLLDEIERLDSPDLISRYRAAWERFHSPAAIRRRLFADL